MAQPGRPTTEMLANRTCAQLPMARTCRRQKEQETWCDQSSAEREENISLGITMGIKRQATECGRCLKQDLDE